MKALVIKEKESIESNKDSYNKASKKNHETERLFIATTGNSI